METQEPTRWKMLSKPSSKDSSPGTRHPPTKKVKPEEANHQSPLQHSWKDDNKTTQPLLLLLHRKDIWVGTILPFLGIGNYIFVAGVCKDMKELYQTYFSEEENKDKLPEVKNFPQDRKALLTDTFYREAFASLSHAKFWDEMTKQKAYRLRDDFICEMIAKYGNVPTLEWAHKQRGFPWDEDTCSSAAKAGRLDILQYAHDNGCPWDIYTCAMAARQGRLDILQYAHENGCPWNDRTCTYAAEAGRLDILQYAHENGCPWNTMTCYYAARAGRLDILKYAHENGCSWDESICSIAVEFGHLKVLQYAHNNGCPWDIWTCWKAASAGRLDILQYAHENGCPWNAGTWHAALNSQSDNHEILEFLRENGCPESYD